MHAPSIVFACGVLEATETLARVCVRIDVKMPIFSVSQAAIKFVLSCWLCDCFNVFLQCRITADFCSFANVLFWSFCANNICCVTFVCNTRIIQVERSAVNVVESTCCYKVPVFYILELK